MVHSELAERRAAWLHTAGTVAAQKPCNNAPAWLRGVNVTQPLLRRLCTSWLGPADNSFPSSQLAPGVLFEALLPEPSAEAAEASGAGDESGAGDGRRLAEDVKCWAFGGRTMFVQQVSGRFDPRTGLQTMRSGKTPKFDTFFWRDGTHLSNLTFRSGSTKPLPASDPRSLRPEAVQRIARACDSLRLDVAFARIDLLRSRSTPRMPTGLALGEVTFGPNGGFAGFPPALDRLLANWWCDSRSDAEAPQQLPSNTLPPEVRECTYRT